MATTDEEWERLFRQRFENYKSEPDEDALEHILSHVKPVSAGKPSARWKKRVGSGLVALGILALLLFSLWQYPPSGTKDQPKAVAVVRSQSSKDPAPSDDFSSNRVTTSAAKASTDNRTSSTDTRLHPEPVKAVFKSPNKTVIANRRLVNRVGFMKRTVPEMKARRKDTAHSSTVNANSRAEPEWPRVQRDFMPIAARTTRFPLHAPVLPEIHTALTDRTPAIEPAWRKAKPSVFAHVMPLYTFRQLTPSRQDEIVMEKIRPATALSARTGWRVQAGTEWALSRTFGLRVGVVYQQLQQQLTYTARALRSDSSRVEWIDPQTMKVTPLYRSQEHQVKTIWRYAAISAEGRLQLNPGQAGLRHYLAAGGSLGFLISGRSRQNWQPIAQASYGIERQLTEQVRLQVEPGIVYNLRSISDNSRCFSVRPYSYGLVIGLRWQPSI
ncbi:hypothetical protein [Larkinella arboricola]